MPTRLFMIMTFFCAFNVYAGNHFVHLKAKNAAERTKIAQYVHIDQVIESSVYTISNEADLKSLKKNIPHMIIETHPIAKKPVSSTNKNQNEIEFPPGDEKYHTYKEVQDKLNKLARAYPAITSVFEFGTSVDGRSIPAIRITGAEAQSEDSFIPGVLFTGAHHAREHLSVEIPMLLIEHLLKNYDKNERIKTLIDTRDLYFVPMLNPDGAMHDIKGRHYKMWRKNRVKNSTGTYGVDLNRNYSFGWGTGGSSNRSSSDVYMGPKPFSEPETIAVKSFIESKPNIRAFLSYHTFSELILYPWGGRYDGIGGKDQKVFETMAKKMATWNGYKPMQASGLYIASGDTCDWAYGEHGIFCFTFELSPKSRWNGGFYPGSSIIDSTFQVNIEPALYLIEKSADPYAVLTNSSQSRILGL